MDTEARILACVDRSHFADSVADHAAWAAIRLAAPLEFLHVIDREPEIGSGEDHSGTIGIGAAEHLLAALAGQDAARTRASREEGRVFLDRLRDRAIAAGVPHPDVRQRHGALDETLVEQQENTQLFVLGRRGASAEITHRDLGRNLERIVRALRRPILTVPDGFRAPARALLAFDGRAASRRAVALVASSPLFAGLRIEVLMAGALRRDAAEMLEGVERQLAAAGREVSTAQVPGDPERAIARAVQERGADLLVMGAYAHSALRGLLFGSRTNDLLRSSTVPTLLLR